MIKIKRAKFHQAVDTADGIPEQMFYDGSDISNPKLHKTVNMVWTSDGLLCSQRKDNGKGDLVCWVVPAANVIQAFYDPEQGIEAHGKEKKAGRPRDC
jgi:hypothetical protein